MGLVLQNVLFLMLVLRYTYCFLPTRNSAVLESDFTMEDIIKLALSGQTTGDTDFNIDQPFNYTCLRENILPVTEDAGRVEESVSEIVNYCNLVDIVQHGNPAWWFADEKITEGHNLLLRLRDRLMQMLLPQKPSYRAARDTLGQMFHLIAMFYSNTNWLEIGHTEIYKNLGIPGKQMDPVAPTTMNTCVRCGDAGYPSCMYNTLTDQFLTSGYFGHQEQVDTVTDDNSAHVLLHGKCRHGGVTDREKQLVSVPGGINKQSESPEFSPHFFLHKNAAGLAIQHIQFYLFNKDVGLLSLLGPQKFSQIFVTDAEMSSVFVDTQDETDRKEIEQLLRIAQMHVLESTSFGNACLQTEKSLVVIRYNVFLIQSEDVPWQCEDKHLRIVNIQASMTNSTGLRHRRALGGLDIYHLIADTSGGTVYETDKSNIAAVVDIIKESVSTKPPVTVMKFKKLSSSSNQFEILIDNLIQNLTIKLQGSSSVPVMKLNNPSGVREQFINSSVASQQTLGRKLRVIKLYNPTPGKWTMIRTSALSIDVDVTASTDLEFSYQFLQPGPGGFGEYPLIGRPIAGENTSVQVSVPLVDRLGSVDKLLLLDRNGNVVHGYTLHNVGGRRGKSRFKTHITIPTKEFEIAVEGTDKAGNGFRRLDPKIISSLAIQLEVLPSSGTLYINQSITIPYRVKNVGGGKTTIKVSITDDKGFAQSPTNRSHSLPSQGSQNNTFVLKAGRIKGETTTVTISAKAVGAPNNKVQFNVRRITVEEKIVRVIDTKAPICNVTSTKGKCDFGADICQCSKHTWEMTALAGDDGDGLQSVFSSGAGPSSKFTHDSFTAGHTLAKGVVHTTLSTDCCHQQAKITVVDLAGNVGLCDVVITPGFVAPDPKLCIAPSNITPSTNANVTTISCNITHLINSCNGSSIGCESKFWSVEAILGNEGYGTMQVAAVNAGKNANITRINNTTVALGTDCCHSDVYINVVDIAGHTGQCHAKVSVGPITTSKSIGGGSLPVAAVAGGAAGGVVVISAVVGIVYYLKTRVPSGKISQDTNVVKSIS